MSPELKECEEKALQLSVHDRALLAEHLIASLDTVGPEENERLWTEEAESRYQAYQQGKISARPAHEVLRDARERIQ